IGICGIDAACVRNAPDEMWVSTWTSGAPHDGQSACGACEWVPSASLISPCPAPLLALVRVLGEHLAQLLLEVGLRPVIFHHAIDVTVRSRVVGLALEDVEIGAPDDLLRPRQRHPV